MRKTVISICLLLGSLSVVTPAHAEFVIKRLKCADTTTSETQDIYRNVTGATRLVSVQIVRDGCRPKGDDGDYWVRRGATSSVVARIGGSSAILQVTIANQQWAEVYFSPGVGVAKGTYDVMVSID